MQCTDDILTPAPNQDYTYTRGELVGVTGYAGPITYHPNGLYASIPHTSGVTVTQENDPDGMARPRSIEATRGAASLWRTGLYGFDGAGNVKRIGTSWFLYDPVSRISTGTVFTGTGGGGVQKQQGFQYDPFANLLAVTGTSARTIDVDSSTNRLADAEYDNAGNMTSFEGVDYKFDPRNQMVRRTTADEDWVYVYTAGGERIWQANLSPGGPRFDRWTLRDLDGKVLRTYGVEGAADWEVTSDYVYRGRQLLAAETSEGRRHFHLDHLGTPRLITDSAGQQVAYHVYFPFGDEATDPFQDEEVMKFTGHERDFNSSGDPGDDLDYMHARHCSPVTGRFVSVDPILGKSKRPQSWNRYAYVLNNPTKYTDPTGETIQLGALSATERQGLIDQIGEFTGNTYKANANNELVLMQKGPQSSPTATKIFDEAIRSSNNYTAKPANSTKVIIGRALRNSNELLLDFDDLTGMDYGKVDSNALGLGAVFTHELIHLSKGLRDPRGAAASTSVGPVVELVNDIRRERGLPTRGPAYGGPIGMKGKVKFNFQNVNPKKPQKVYYVRVPL